MIVVEMDSGTREEYMNWIKHYEGRLMGDQNIGVHLNVKLTDYS